MARKFITQAEVDFIHHINKELIQGVVGEEVKYYAISLKHTEVDPLYNEAIKKTWMAPVSVNALVRYDNPSETSTQFGLDQKFTLEVYFHNVELLERNVEAKEGDFIEYGKVFYEITSVTHPQLIFGQVNNKILVKCMCAPSREGQFQAGNQDDELVNNGTVLENNTPFDPYKS